MFEGLVRQLLLGYLGRYIKDIHKDQLKITVWNEEVLLENVELILEAFDYLQLPLALQQGRVGRLSIKIPWKKLGREPIIIIVEDVFIYASQRNDHEWSLDAVERREFAGKKAQLATAELAKLSRRVCDSQAGNPFMSFIAAKILDSIQVSIRNFHVLYGDVQSDLVRVVLGLRFSSLMISKQTPIGPSTGKARGGQVNKLVEVEGLEIYCGMYEGDLGLMSFDSKGGSNFLCNAGMESDKLDYLLKPFNLSLTLLVNRSGELLPQYSISAKLTDLVMSLNEVQLQQIFILFDYLQTSQLREKYGRYRPCCSSLSKKPDGWQKQWWHYAQESVLSDVRKKLKKTSWRFFGQRLSNRRRYINLYRTKLDFLQREQPIDNFIILELEAMEKECDIDDILRYRSAAETEMQETLSESKSTIGTHSVNATAEKPRSDDRTSIGPRGWLNWLSRGMLGAGGTDDSSQFSGVVSDEVVKDIHEATEFDPLSSSPRDFDGSVKIYTCAIKFDIHKLSAALKSVHCCQVIAKLDLTGGSLECKLWEGLSAISVSINSGRMVYPPNGTEILTMEGAHSERNAVETEPSCRAQVDVSQEHDVGLSVKVILQPVEVTYDMEFLRALIKFFNGSKSFELQNKRVLSSLNGLEDAKTRLVAKAEYILSSSNKVKWDVSILNLTTNFPWKKADSENCKMVFELGSLCFITKCNSNSLTSSPGEQSNIINGFLGSLLSLNDYQVQDLYNHFEVKLSDFEIKLMRVHSAQVVHVLEKSCAFINLACFIIPDESIVKQFEVNATVAALNMTFSPSVYQSVLEVTELLDIQSSRSHDVTSNSVPLFSFAVNVNLALVRMHVNLANDGENSTALVLSLRELDVWYSSKEFEEGSICMKGLEIIAHPLQGGADTCILCSSGILSDSTSAPSQEMDVELQGETNTIDCRTSSQTFFQLQYKACKNKNLVHHEFSIYWRDTDLHCYPYIFGLLAGFFDKILSYKISSADNNCTSPTLDCNISKTMPQFGFQRFGFSNFSETGSSGCACIPLDRYPFITIYNSGSLGSLESSLSYSIPGWRKLFNLRDKKLDAGCSSKFECNSHAPPPNCTNSSNAFSPSEGCGDRSLYAVDINLFGISVHFHDSSCILGTVVLPASKSSLIISDDCMDAVCSAEDLNVKSSLYTKYEFLWGPSSNLSPLLNIRVRKGNLSSSGSKLEVCIGVQHVCSIMPSEYLSIIKGYFSLPDWKLKLSPQIASQTTELVDVHYEPAITYKFEVLDSAVILPVESDDLCYLKMDIQQLYCSFIPDCASSNVMLDIPPECVVPLHKVAKINDYVNIFGRDLSLILLLSENGGHGGLTFELDTGNRSITLAAPVSADVWVRIPCESNISSASRCIMSKISICQVIADDMYSLRGLEALLEVIDKCSVILDESKIFTSDVLQFFQSKNHLKEHGALESITNFKEIRCIADSFIIKLHRLWKDSDVLEPVARADTKFLLSASLENKSPISLDVRFSTIEFYSLLNSILLAQCTNSYVGSSVLDVRFTRRGQHESELFISLPSVDIWLHCFEWIEVIQLYESYSQNLANTVQVDSLQKGLATDAVDTTESAADDGCENTGQASNSFAHCVPENSKQEIMTLAAKSENIGVTIHFPFCASETAFKEHGIAEVQKEISKTDPLHTVEGKSSKLITVTVQSQCGELLIGGKDVKMNFTFGKVDGTVAIRQVTNVSSWPLFHISEVILETEIQKDLMKNMCINVVILCDCLEMYVSHQILSVCHDIALDFPESKSSQHKHGSLRIKVQIRDLSLLISDGRWSCSGPLLEVLMRELVLQSNATENNVESSITSDLEVNYHNIHKVLWESFVEPWNFEIRIIRKSAINTLLSGSTVTDIVVASSVQLNLNLTESVIECVFRTIEMLDNAWGLKGPDDIPENKKLLHPHSSKQSYGKGYAPYVLQNLTSLPLVYQVYQGLSSDVLDVSAIVDENFVHPGASAPIYLSDTPGEQLFYHRHHRSYGSSTEKQSNGVIHHLMTIQLDGTSVPSAPCSMDRVGVTYFEVDFSKASDYNKNVKENGKAEVRDSLVVPVVFEVSLQRHSKLIRLYSTVIILNATSMPLELRFDIPFSISPKILDPVFPGQEFPLPLHLAEAGRMRWRPLGNSYLWSEAHSISKVLLQGSKIGFLRSFACYPSHPSSEPFRCCISVESIDLPTSGPSMVSSFQSNDLSDGSNHGRKLLDLHQSKKRFIHQVTLSTPLVLNNCLPEPVSLTIESGGIAQAALLSEVETSFHNIDPSHDLVLEFRMCGFRPSVLRFPRSELFSTVAKFSGKKFSQIETLRFDPDLSGCALYVTFEKAMDVNSGAREVFIFVPFLLYNCTESPLIISDCANEMNGATSTIPSCYDMIEQHFIQSKKDGLGILSYKDDSCDRVPSTDAPSNSSSFERIILTRRNINSQLERMVGKSMTSSNLDFYSHEVSETHYPGPDISSHSKSLTDTCLQDNEHGKVKACIYSPCPISTASDITVRIRRSLPGSDTTNIPHALWSAPFPLVPPSGSTTVLVPQSSSSAASIVSVTCFALSGAFSGRTQAITFQPRYIICNSCSKDVCYKQKGTNLVSHLGAGQQSHLYWTDSTRELLVSIRFNEPGWQWSGSFLPDHLGDTQVKMRNYVSGALNMVRVEVQNADISGGDEKIVGSLHRNAGTNLILLSDDDTGYMPYRIDNFSKERLRVYQQKCETFDTIVHPYTSCPYAWDEPCYTHRLTIEVPGDRVLGSYALDDIKEPVSMHLRSTSERPERTLLLSVNAEGPTKVLSIIDSSYHAPKDIKDQFTSKFQEKGTQKQEKDKTAFYLEKFSLVLPAIGISVINSRPQELMFACATNIMVDLLQSIDQQKLSFQISSLQIDNQLCTSSYPVILSFNHEYRGNLVGHRFKNNRENSVSEIEQQVSTNSQEPVFYFSAAKWRKKEASLVSFEYVTLRIADFRLELELETVLSLLEFIKIALPNSQSTLLPLSDPTLHPLNYGVASVKDVNTKEDAPHARNIPVFNKSYRRTVSLPSIVPIGAPWQQIHLLARRHRKIYVEMFELAPVKFTLSFSSTPWMLRNGVLTSGESLIHRGLMALADVEGARIHLNQLTIAHHMASKESFQEILIGHYTRQFLHEIYKVLGSAGVIGNPMGFARNVGVGIKDFLSAPARSITKSPTGLIEGMAQGTTSLVSNTVYALTDAATQFSKAAHKGIVAFTFNDHDVARMEKQQKGEGSQSKGIISEVFEGLTGLLQSPIKGAEKHGLPGVFSGIALGVTGLVARPAASILEVTGKTAQSIRNRSRLHNTRSRRYRVRLPRPLSGERPLKPYSWEEAVGTSVLMAAGGGLRLKDEVLVVCKALKQPGKFVVVTGKLILIVSCPSLVDFGKPEFRGVAADPEWLIETEIGLDSVIHATTSDGTVHVVGSSSDALSRQKQNRVKKSGFASGKLRNDPASAALPLFQTDLDLPSKEDAEDLLRDLLSTIDAGKSRGWGSRHLIIHQSNIRQ